MQIYSIFRNIALVSALIIGSEVKAQSEYVVDSLNSEGNTTYVMDSLQLMPDTTERKEVDNPVLEKLSNNKFARIAYTSAPLIAMGLIVKGQNKHFRSLRNDYLPKFRRHVDDYLQYAPAAVLLGMKSAGVESRSSWGRMLTSDAFSAALMAGMVNSLKFTTKVRRPDGTDRHSYPSGHTATAFMTATMLTKEYGHKSPWIGIGAYGVASATGLMRMANNKHWLSDVLTGAGIGILSAEVGYYFADLIFKNRGLRPTNEMEVFRKYDKPSFLSLNFEISIPISNYEINENSELKTSSGSIVSVEGAHFFSPYIGVGGRLSAMRTAIIVDEKIAEDDSFDALKMGVGAYFSYPLSSRWLIGSKILAQYVHYPDLQLTSYVIDSRSSAGLGTGLSVTFKARQRYGFRLLVDYDLLPYHSSGSRKYMHSLTLGTAFLVTF